MRIAIIGQQNFGKATLEAFLARGDQVRAVFCAPAKGRPDPLRLAAEAQGVPVSPVRLPLKMKTHSEVYFGKISPMR